MNNASNGEHALLMESFESNANNYQSMGASGLSQQGSGINFGMMVPKEDIEQEELDKYDIRQFLMDTALRFYSSNVASIEIDYK